MNIELKEREQENLNRLGFEPRTFQTQGIKITAELILAKR